jgi:hypothetical protein
MESLSILCAGGRGEPLLAGRSGGGYGAKKIQIKKGWSLAIYSFYKYFLLVDKKNAR